MKPRELTLELSWHTATGPIRRLSRVIKDPLFVPRVGDDVQLAPGWASATVTVVFLLHDGNANVRLDGGRNVSSKTDAELWSLTEHGWS